MSLSGYFFSTLFIAQKLSSSNNSRNSFNSFNAHTHGAVIDSVTRFGEILPLLHFIKVFVILPTSFFVVEKVFNSVWPNFAILGKFSL